MTSDSELLSLARSPGVPPRQMAPLATRVSPVAMDGLDSRYVEGFVAFAAWADFEFDRLAFFERTVAVACNVAVVNEDIVTIVTRDKAVALLVVEEFYCS